MRIGFIAVIVAVCALSVSAVLIQQRVASADGHGCPSSWPSQSYEGLHTDDSGQGWFLIRSTDSNGFTTIRAYAADDNHSAGYAPGSPDEICVMLVRRHGDSEDVDQPQRLVFSQEREEPSQAPANGPGSGGGGGGGGNGSTSGQGNVVAVLAASLEIMRHSGALIAADLPNAPADVRPYAGMVAAREAALNAQLAILAANSQSSRVGEIDSLVDRLVSNIKMIQRGRPDLFRAVASESASREQLTMVNRGQLFPNADENADEQFYSLVSGDAGASTADVLRYSHLSSLSSNVALGHTFLLVASLMQDPTFVARIRESYDSVANRIDRDILYLQTLQDAVLQRDVLNLARAGLNAGSGPNNYFDRLETRLRLIVAENDLKEENAHSLALLRDEIGRLRADVLEQQHPAPETMPAPGVQNPGVTATEVKFGQSAALTGPSAFLGTQMEIGIRAAFAEANAAGGVHGRTLNLLPTLDDRYEPDAAFANTRKLIEEDQVFGLIGAVGTPTSRAASPLANADEVPFIAPFTGAQLLRDDGLTNVLNLRASYHQETERMVEYLVGRGFTDVAVLYQNDSYGVDGLTGVEQELNERGMQVTESWYYRRNTSSVQSAVYRISEADPQAVIIIGASAPAAQAISMLREKLGPDTIFMNVSFVGSNALATALGPAGQGVFVTQVVPLPTDTSNPLVAKYQAALSAYDSGAVPGFISLEGYLAGRLAVEGLQRCGQALTRTCFLQGIQNAGTFNLDGFQLTFGAADNQGSDEVFLTEIDANQQFQPVP